MNEWTNERTNEVTLATSHVMTWFLIFTSTERLLLRSCGPLVPIWGFPRNLPCIFDLLGCCRVFWNPSRAPPFPTICPPPPWLFRKSGHFKPNPMDFIRFNLVGSAEGRREATEGGRTWCVVSSITVSPRMSSKIGPWLIIGGQSR